jgi:glucose-1-phosphate adenylyltransferase
VQENYAGGGMHDRVVTFILAGQDGGRLQPLTADQSVATLPFGGVFRLIDFVLSNVLNAQLRHVYILRRHKPDAVNAYIQSSWPHLSADFRWDCGEDLVCLKPSESLCQIPEIMKKTDAEHAIVVCADQIYQMEYRKLLRQHVAGHVQVTSPFKGVYVFNREALVGGADLLLESYNTTSPGFAGYCRTIETLDDYYAANMDFLTDRPGFDPYSRTKLLQTSRFASNSRVALGARLSSCKVSGSVIFAGARVENGAVVENCVILAGSHIGPGAVVRNAIVAENALVPAEARLGSESGITVFATPPETNHPLRQIRRRCARVATKAGLAVS